MKSSKYFSLVALNILTCLPISPMLYAEQETKAQTQAETTTATKKKVNILENQLKQILKIFNAIDFNLESLGGFIREDAVETNDKDKLISRLTGIRRQISAFRQSTVGHIDEQALYILLEFAEGIMDHIECALDNGFKKLPEFNGDQIITRSKSKNATTDDIDLMIKVIDGRIESFKDKSENVGLSFYNIFYRQTFDKYVYEWWEKYNVTEKVFYTTFVTAAGVYFWYWFNSSQGGTPNQNGEIHSSINEDDGFFMRAAKSAHDKINGWIRGTLGWPYPEEYISRLDIQNYELDHEVGKLGQSEHRIFQATKGYMPIGSMIFWGALQTIAMEKLYQAKDWIAEKLDNLHNWLKGGIYRKRSKEARNKPYRFEPEITFDDIIGQEHAKQILSEVLQYIEDAERFDRTRLAPEKGYLLTGATRTGKSYIAEALSGEIIEILKRQGRDEDEFGFWKLPARALSGKGNISKIVEMFKKWAPCVVFIDEIDMLGLQRDRNSELLAEFLDALSGCFNNDPKKAVIFIAATNKPENLDDSLRARGRFGKEIRFEYPSYANRKEYILKKLEGLTCNTDLFDIDKLARETEGKSFEDIQAILRSAFFKTKIQGQVLTQQHLEGALDLELRNIIESDYLDLPEYDTRVLAVHMAGHALMQMLLPTNELLAKVTIKPMTARVRETSVFSQYHTEQAPGIEYGKMFTYHINDTLDFASKEELINICKIKLAGRVAEQLLLGSATNNNMKTCSSHDKPMAFNIAKEIILDGLYEGQVANSKKMQNKIIDDAYALLELYEKEVTEILEQFKDTLVILALGLQEFKELSLEQVQGIMQLVKEAQEKEAKKEDGDDSKTDESADNNNNANVSKAVKDELGIEEVQVSN